MISKLSFGGIVSLLTIFILPYALHKPNTDIQKIRRESDTQISIEKIKLDALIERMIKKDTINVTITVR